MFLNNLDYCKKKKELNNKRIIPLKLIKTKTRDYSLENIENFEIILPKELKKDINNINIINLNPVQLSLNQYKKLSLNNKNDYKPLHFACYFGDEKSVNQIVNQNKQEIDEVSKDGYTPLFIAVANNYYNIVKILINNGANKNIKNKEGKLPIDIAKIERI
jgi:ankyrin repeat protein